MSSIQASRFMLCTPRLVPRQCHPILNMDSMRLLKNSCLTSRYEAFKAASTRPGRMISRCHLDTQCQVPAQPVARRAAIAGALAAGLLPHLVLEAPAAAVSVPQCAELSTAANGIQYCDVREGTGKVPSKGSLIRCHYRGRLASNNAVFDSSYDRGRPLSFKVGVREVIAGWDAGILGSPEEGIPPMKEGGKRVLVIPPTLAYGERGAGRGVIPPNATLIFDVELLGRR